MKRLLSILSAAAVMLSTLVFASAQGSVSDDPEYYKHVISQSVQTTQSDASLRTVAAAYSDSFTGKSYTHADKYLTGDYEIQQGIDVSEFQNVISAENWKQVKAAGVQFAIVRVGYRGSSTGGLYADARYSQNISNAISAGIPVGVYIYSQAITAAEAKEEANFVLSRIGDYDITLPVVIDFEYAADSFGAASGRLYNAKLSKATATSVINTFCNTVMSAGYTPMVYANASMLTGSINAQDLAADVWLAHYATKTTYTGDYSFWQYSCVGKVDGISTDVDVNFRYVSNDTAVKNITVTSRKTDSLKIAWSEPTHIPQGYTLTGYNVYRYKSSTGSYQLVMSNTAQQNTYTLTSLKPTTLYRFRIDAVFGDDKGNTYIGKASYYSTVTKTAAVTNFAFTPSASTSSSIKLTWSAVSNATGYVVYRYDSAGGTYKSLKTVSASTLTYTNSSLSANKSYKYKVRAYRTLNGKKYYSDYTDVLVGYTSPAKLTNLTASSTGSKKIKLSWKKVSGATGYKVYRYSTSKKKYVLIKTITSADKLTYTDTVTAKKKYKYAVKAYKSVSGGVVSGTSAKLTAVGKCSGKVTASVLNLRSSASSSSNVKKRLVKGTKVTIAGQANSSWYKISVKVNGKTYTGYVSQNYVKIV